MISVQFVKTNIVAFAIASFLFFGIIGEGFAAGMPAQPDNPIFLLGTWAADGDKNHPQLRIDFVDGTSNKFALFQKLDSKWVKFAEIEEKELPNQWLVKSTDGIFHIGTPVTQLGLRKVDDK